jgi:uncharacterized protein YcbK (DUF882 family)
MSTKHFKTSEFACKHCGEVKVSNHLLSILELVRLRFGKPVIVTSGYRCEVHNKNVGGAPKSKHIEGIAADIKVKGIKPSDVFDFLDETFPDQYGIGLYSSWVHIDDREIKARW